MTDLALNFKRLKEQVLRTTPVLKETLERNGNETLFAHALKYAHIKANAVFADRQAEFIGTVADQVENLLGLAVARSVSAQLTDHYFVSTADHHGPICHPFWLNADIITAAPYVGLPKPELENIIVLSCANVSLNNSSFPRGLIFHSDIGNPNEVHQLSFFPAKERSRSVYGFRSYTQKDLNHVKKIVSDKVWHTQVRPEVAEKILYIIDSVYSQPVALEAGNYSKQITKTNFELWPQFFGSAKHAPNLIYLDQETITRDLLVNYHLNGKTIISDILLNRDYQPLILKYFDGIIGAFATERQTGTYLFWGLPAGAKYRERLWISGGELVNNTGTFRVRLTASEISGRLQSGELIPSVLLTFLVISFYYGVTALGGFSQPSYLTAIKDAYAHMLQETGNNKEAAKSQMVETAISGGSMALAFLQDKNGTMHQATGLDLLLYGNSTTWSSLVETAKIMSMQESVDIMMPLFYEVMYPEIEREPALRQITTGQIAKLNGLDKKIKPCVFM